MRLERKFILFLLLASFALFCAACLPEKDAGAVRVNIAGRVFKIPKGYFDGAAPTGRDTESVVLEYSLPGFEVLPRERAERMSLIKAGRAKGMLLENAEKRPSFDEVMPWHMNGLVYKRGKSIHGLEHYVHVPPKPVRPEPEYRILPQDDILIERNLDGTVKSYLFCSPPGKAKNPSCEHRFINKGLLYDISWRIQELPNWQAQRDAAIQFIDSLEFKESNGE